jgi:hypothetical protein
MEIVHFVGASQLGELLVAQPDVLFSLSSRRHPDLLRRDVSPRDRGIVASGEAARVEGQP